MRSKDTRRNSPFIYCKKFSSNKNRDILSLDVFLCSKTIYNNIHFINNLRDQIIYDEKSNITKLLTNFRSLL